jgi:hypothetical protein
MKKQFKVGDKVRLKKNLKVGNKYGKEYGRLTLLPTMVFDGAKKISEDICNGTCLLDNGYYYSYEMLIKEKP